MLNFHRVRLYKNLKRGRITFPHFGARHVPRRAKGRGEVRARPEGSQAIAGTPEVRGAGRGDALRRVAAATAHLAPADIHAE